VNIDKKNPLCNVACSVNIKDLADQSVVLVDDVLNSGKTLIYAIRHFLQVPLRKFKTAVLVNRNHKNFPVKSDFKGISLSTSLEEHIEVSFKNKVEAILY
jgi:pyrimidine operon attenuation protein/uracil phosphoribosyltransferase